MRINRRALRPTAPSDPHLILDRGRHLGFAVIPRSWTLGTNPYVAWCRAAGVPYIAIQEGALVGRATIFSAWGWCPAGVADAARPHLEIIGRAAQRRGESAEIGWARLEIRGVREERSEALAWRLAEVLGAAGGGGGAEEFDE